MSKLLTYNRIIELSDISPVLGTVPDTEINSEVIFGHAAIFQLSVP